MELLRLTELSGWLNIWSVVVACVDLPALPLQLVWRREPAMRAQAVVVIDEDRPQGKVLWACERARAMGVLPGMRYAHALALCSSLRARVVPDEHIVEAITELRAAFAKLSPEVEPSDDPGTFWLDGSGLERIFGASWGAEIARAASELDYRGSVVVGFSRFATYAVARGSGGGGQGGGGGRGGGRSDGRRGGEMVAGMRVLVFASDADERGVARAVPLARLDLDATLRDGLARLGVTTVGELVRLPAGGILERFGSDAHRLYQLALGERWDPIVPVAPPEAPDERVLLDDEDDDVERLAFVLKGATDRLLGRLAARSHACRALHLELTLRPRGEVASSTLGVATSTLHAECIVPAFPTLDGRSLARLVHLRLSGAPPKSPVIAVRVWADEVEATREQLALFSHKPRRDLRAGDEALARLRAEMGDDAVVKAVLRDGHLPEASFAWEQVVHLIQATPNPRAIQPLVRRLLARPQPLPQQARQVRDDGWLLSDLEHGAITRIVGPYIVSGGWWAHELHREYHFADLRRGDTLWVYFDRPRRRWFWQGALE